MPLILPRKALQCFLEILSIFVFEVQFQGLAQLKERHCLAFGNNITEMCGCWFIKWESSQDFRFNIVQRQKNLCKQKNTQRNKRYSRKTYQDN